MKLSEISLKIICDNLNIIYNLVKFYSAKLLTAIVDSILEYFLMNSYPHSSSNLSFFLSLNLQF